MADLKKALYQYFAQKHFNDMPDDQMARFKDYIKAKDYQGHMRWWKSEFMNDDNTKKELPDFTKTLADAEWETLYMWFQEALQSMHTDMQDGVYEHDVVIEPFIKKWFGPGKVFQSTTATDDTNKAFEALAKFLEDNKSLERYFKKNLKDVFDGTVTYDGFIKKIREKKYDSDLKFRDKIDSVITYITNYGPTVEYSVPNPAYWPTDVGYDAKDQGFGNKTVDKLKGDFLENYCDTTNPNHWINQPTDERFELKEKNTLRDIFKANHRDLLNTLLAKGKIRNEFEKHDHGTGSKISSQLKKALEDTGYNDKESKDYVIPKQTDDRSLLDRIKKKKDDTYDNYFKQFLEPRYGARMYYSPYAQNIAKAFDKVGIKPTDGIDGILAKKDDILKEINKTVAGKSKSHFDWFVKTMEKIKTADPKAYGDALKNPHQMRNVVSHVIIEAINSDPQNIAEAKTAMEMLAVTRYGILTSKTRNALNEGLKDVSILSDDKLSWNKNESIKFVTGAIDATAKFGIKAGALAVTGLYNLIKNNRKRKFGKDISDCKDLAAAYSTWRKEDKANMDAEIGAADANLNLLTNGLGKSGHKIDSSTVGSERDILKDLQDYDDAKKVIENLTNLADGKGKSGEKIDAASLATQKAKLKADPDNTKELAEDIKLYEDNITKQSAARKTLTDLQLGKGKSGAVYNDSNRSGFPKSSALEDDIKRYDELMVYKNGTDEKKENKWREQKANKDKFHELIRYWDMLDTFSKTHSFGLGSIKARRDDFLKDFGEKDKSDPDELKSQAEKDARDFAKLIAAKDIKLTRD